MGIDFWRSKGFTDEEVQRAVDRANREWDTLLVPSEECVAYYREQYDFSGDFLVTGYPRCDALVNADAAAVRRTVLSRVGVDEGQTVVLYAPTYRDRLNTRLFAAARFDELELGRLATAARPRLHAARPRAQQQPARARPRDRDGAGRRRHRLPRHQRAHAGRDVAVLDYSSLRFDWAITGKPMVFFVPDLDDYFALRRPLFPYEGTAPGPWTSTTEEVADALSDVPRCGRRYGAEHRAVQPAVQRPARRARQRAGARGVLRRPGRRVSVIRRHPDPRGQPAAAHRPAEDRVDRDPGVAAQRARTAGRARACSTRVPTSARSRPAGPSWAAVLRWAGPSRGSSSGNAWSPS